MADLGGDIRDCALQCRCNVLLFLAGLESESCCTLSSRTLPLTRCIVAVVGSEEDNDRSAMPRYRYELRVGLAVSRQGVREVKPASC
jgi:hypothetical protein